MLLQQEQGHSTASSSHSDSNQRNNLIVNYLPHATTSDQLHALFSKHGGVQQAKVILDR